MGMRRAMLASVLLGVFSLVGGLALAAGNESTQSGRCLHHGPVAERHVRPGVAVDVGDSWWPVGTRCSYHYADGSSAEAVARLPLSDLIVVVIASGAVAATPVLIVFGSIARASRAAGLR
jgi:hypothetical protein